MNKILMIVIRDYKAAIRSRGFLIGLIAAPVFMGGSFVATTFFQNRVDTTDRKIAVIDHSGVIFAALEKDALRRNEKDIYTRTSREKIKPAYLLSAITAELDNTDSQRLVLSEHIRAGELDALLEIGANVLHPQRDDKHAFIHYHAKSSAMDELPRWLESRSNDQLRRLRLTEAGVDTSQVRKLFHWVPVQSLSLIARDEHSGGITAAHKTGEAELVGAPMVMLMLMFMIMIWSAVPLLHAVMEEKAQRISEVILGSVDPFQFMMGKVLGGVAVSLTASAVYLVCAVFLVTNLGLAGIAPFHVIPWFFVYMVLAILMFGSLFAGLGSICSDAKDAQSLTMPAMLPIMIPMFMLMPILREPNGSFATWMSLFPPFTPMVMIIRQSMPDGVPAWQPWVGLVGVLAFTVLFVWIGSRIFRIGILLQGKPPRLGDVVRLALRG